MNTNTISEDAYIRASNRLNCELAVIKAVAEVESRGAGFLPSGKPTILFEAHWFDRLTNGKYRENYPNISCERWDRSLYIGGEREHDRLDRAMSLDWDSAIQSASWGAFQIMGFNYKACNCETVREFHNRINENIDEHLLLFTEFIISKNLGAALRAKKWDAFAYSYNGPRYKENNYAEKMARAYEKYKSIHENLEKQEKIKQKESQEPQETPRKEEKEESKSMWGSFMDAINKLFSR